eukprot:1309625-Pyramimonas_sp.AAC.1
MGYSVNVSPQVLNQLLGKHASGVPCRSVYDIRLTCRAANNAAFCSGLASPRAGTNPMRRE